MPTVKPTKPSITLPTAFGTSSSNVKTQFTPQELIDGYSASIPQVLDGGNLNYIIDAMFQYLTWSNAYADWYASGSANTVPYINSSNQLDYATPVFTASNNTFTGNNTFTSNVKIDKNSASLELKASYTYGTSPSSNEKVGISTYDTNGYFTGGFERWYYNNGDTITQIGTRKQDLSDNYAIFGVGYTASGNEYVSASAGVKKQISNWNVPDYSQRIEITSPYTPTKNGIIVAQCRGGGAYVWISTNDDFLISNIQCADSAASVQVAWAIVASGETYLFGGNPDRTNTFHFVPFKEL